MKSIGMPSALLLVVLGIARPVHGDDLYMVRIPTDPTRVGAAGQQAADANEARMSQLIFGKGVAANTVASADITLRCDRYTSVTVTKTDGTVVTEAKDVAVDIQQLNAFLARHRQVHAAYLRCDQTN